MAEEVKEVEEKVEEAAASQEPAQSQEAEKAKEQSAIQSLLAGTPMANSATDALISEMGKAQKDKYIDAEKAREFATDPHADVSEEGEEGQEQEIDSSYELPTNARHKNLAKHFTKLTDNGMALSLALIAKEEDSSLFKAREDQLKEIEEEMIEVVKLIAPNLNIPPWVWLLFALVGIYGSKVPMALEVRKANLGAAEYPEWHPKAEKKNSNREFIVSKQDDDGKTRQIKVNPEHLCQNPNCNNPRPEDKRKAYCSEACKKQARNLRNG